MKEAVLFSEYTPLSGSPPKAVEDNTSPKEYGLVQGSRVMFWLTGTVNPE